MSSYQTNLQNYGVPCGLVYQSFFPQQILALCEFLVTMIP